ncbi:MAG: PAS domain-containing protein [Jaaginema sp. PMC 1079.18]|nr:PAS domain-containing protein [Jaaginema sp. PMC 1080.18]MEC4851561.1 PAS domain-containing protein [Jaaginema sp. PMC 1079.18]MEC4868284.1 PAS domain-containing protein [Jaaginema sp. PMC 1078.18]
MNVHSLDERFFNLSLDLLCVAGQDGYFKRLNPSWTQVLGYSDAELKAEPFINFVHPGDRDRTLTEVANIFTGNGNVRFENRYRAKNGNYRWLSWTSSFSLADQCIYGVARDITERKTAEATQKALLNAIPDLMFRCRRDGTFIDYKPAKNLATLLPPQEFIGKTLWETLPSTLADTIFEVQNQALISQQVEVLEYDLKMPDAWHWYEARIVANGDAEIIAIVRDITTQKQNAQEIEARSRRTSLKSEIGQALAQSQDFKEMLERCTNALVKHLNASFARIWTVDDSNTHLHLQASSGLYTHIDGAHSRIRIGDYKIGRIAALGEPHISNDVPNDPQVSDREWAKREGMVAFAGYPLIINNHLIGVMALFSQHHLDKNILTALETIANEIAIGIEYKKTTIALEQNKERLQLALEGSALGYWDWQIPTGTTYFDRQWKQMLGYADSDIENSYQAWKKLIHPDDSPHILSQLQGYLRGETPLYEVELRMLNKSGQWQWILARGKVFQRDKAGNPVRMNGTHLDINDRKTAEAALRKSQHQLQEAQRIASIGSWEMEVSSNKITWSEELFEIYGFKRGKAPTFLELLRTIHPEDRQTWLKHIQRAIASGIPYAVDHRIIRPDGELRHLNGRGEAVWDESAKIVRIIGTAMDISDRVSAELETQLLLAVIQAISDTSDLESAVNTVLQLIGTTINWDISEAWLPNHEGQALQRIIGGYSSDNALQDFLQESQTFVLNPGQGIPGRVWTTQQPEWHENVIELAPDVFCRTELAAKHRLKTCFSIPICADRPNRDREVLAVLVFFRRTASPQDQRLIQLIEAIALQLGSFVQRKQTETELLRIKAAVDGSSDAVGMTDLNGRVIYHNRAMNERYGWTPEEINQSAEGPGLLHVDVERVTAAFQAIQNGQSWLGEVNLRTRDGEIVPNLLRADCIRDRAGQPIGLIGIHTDITARKQAEARVQEQLKREILVSKILERIRSSLNFEAVLQTAVDEIRAFLQTDRTVIYRFDDDWTGYVTVESVAPGWNPILGMTIADECFPLEYAQLYHQGRIRAIADVPNSDLAPCHKQLLQELQVQANLALPILQSASDNNDGNSPDRLWGLLIAHHCQSPRPWTESEIDCLEEISIQLAIALQQCNLFEQAQNELSERIAAEVALRKSESRERERARELEALLKKLQKTQAQLVQSEKMVSLGQLVAGVAHEINNPVGFIYSNVSHAKDYASDLMEIISLYQKHYPYPHVEISETLEILDLDFLKADFLKLLQSMTDGADRIKDIVLSLRTFSRLDEAEKKEADLHAGIESTLMVLKSRLREQANRPAVEVIRQFASLPRVECYPGQLNQVLMNLINNAIDALEEKYKQNPDFTPTLHISTATVTDPQNDKSPKIRIAIADNGSGIPLDIQERIFDPFFTTKPIGKGTGLGLSISYQIIVDRHEGSLECHSQVGQGTEFVIEI